MRLFFLLIRAAFLLAAPALAVRAADASQPVTVSDRGASVVLKNGLVSVEINKANGNILALNYSGKSLLAEAAYLDWNAGQDFHLGNGNYTLRANPSTDGGNLAEVVISQKYGGTGPALDIALHHVLRRGDSGFYSYAVFSHPASYPATSFGQSRMVFRLSDAVFDFINVDDDRRHLMPVSDTPTQSLGPKESLQFTSGPYKGQITDKYHFYADAGDHYVHGWSGTASKLGCWLVIGSTEDRNGGPTKQYNTVQFGRLLFKILTCGHYGAAGVSIAAGENWSKVYGPWLVYLNSGGTPDQLWADAKKRADAERAAWPYPWVADASFPLAAQRGTVTGQLQITDPQDPAASPANAWIGLAAPSPDWQQQSGGYQFWVRAAQDGSFTLPNVRPGNYTLYAFVDGVMDQFRHDHLSVAAGQKLALGTLAWTPVRYGRQLWQIGTPDRTAKEFRHGDDYRLWGLWQKYPQEFPHDVNFVIGQSHERTDWNYSQVNVDKNGQWVGTDWKITFHLPDKLPAGNATLRLAFASTHNAAIQVFVNGTDAGGTGRLPADNAMIRAGIHGQYCERDISFSTALLRDGPNQITLRQREGGSEQKEVMYDCVRLEVPATPATTAAPASTATPATTAADAAPAPPRPTAMPHAPKPA
jgi:rhamnogalacturonan endolyase